MNDALLRKCCLAIVVTLCLLATSWSALEGADSGALQDDAIFRLAGQNSTLEHSFAQCYYDMTVGCHLESDLMGFRTYSINWVILKITLYYHYSMPAEGWAISEHCSMLFQSVDFDLSPGVSKILYMAKGATANPYDADWFNVELDLARDKTFGPTPKGSQIVFKDYDDGSTQSADLYLATLDASGDYAEAGYFYGDVLLKPPYEYPQTTFGVMLLQDTFCTVKYLDAGDTDREVVGAAADSASRVVVEVSGSDSEPVVTIPEGGGNWAFDSWDQVGEKTWRNVWAAPGNFCTFSHQYDQVASRSIDFEFTLDGKSVPGPPFYLYKPPVLLIHGLFSYGTMWNAMAATLNSQYVGGDQLLVNACDYDTKLHFSENVPVILLAVKDAVDRASGRGVPGGATDAFGQIVVKRADVVAHSLGGIMANLYVTDGRFRHDVNRIITIETPHSGSEVANFLRYLLCQAGYGQRLAWQLVDKYLVGIDRSPMADGIEDLQVDSDAIKAYRIALANTDPDVRVFPIAGLHSQPGPGGLVGGLYAFLYLMDNFLYGNLYFAAPYSPLSVEAGLFPGGAYSSDFVVSLLSQSGGLIGLVGDPLAIVDHCNTADVSATADRVIGLLNSPVCDFSSHFAPPYDYPTPSVGVVGPECSLQAADRVGTPHDHALQIGQHTELEIVQPAAGTIFAPGDSVTMEVSYSGQPYSRVMFFSALGDSASDYSSPYQFRFAIDDNCAGPLQIAAAAISGSWETADSLIHEITINVVPSVPPDEISVWPEGPVYLTMGETRQLRVRGRYPGDLTRDVTSSVVGTAYSSSDPSVASVSPNGLLAALAFGESRVRAENGVSEEFYVVVDSATVVGMAFAGASTSVDGDCVTLSWEMGVEVPASSFRVERAESSDGPFGALGVSVSKLSMHSFSCVDCSVTPGKTYWYRIGLSGSGGVETCGPIEAFVPAIPVSGVLHQSYPNPFNPTCTIRYEVPEAGRVSLRIFDVGGALVRTLVAAHKRPGVYTESWDGRADDGRMLPSGVYFYRLQAGNFVASRKMVLLR